MSLLLSLSRLLVTRLVQIIIKSIVKIIYTLLIPCWYFKSMDVVLRSLPYRNQSIDLQSRSMDWFLYDTDIRHKRVNIRSEILRWSVIGHSGLRHNIRIRGLTVQIPLDAWSSSGIRHRYEAPIKVIFESKIE